MNAQQPPIPNPNAVLPFSSSRPLTSSSTTQPMISHQSSVPSPPQPHTSIPGPSSRNNVIRNHETNRLEDHSLLSHSLFLPPPPHLAKPTFQPPPLIPERCNPYLNNIIPSYQKVADAPRNLSKPSSNHPVHFVNNSKGQGDLSPTK